LHQRALDAEIRNFTGDSALVATIGRSQSASTEVTVKSSRRRVAILAGTLAAIVAAVVVIVVVTRDERPTRIAIATSDVDGLPPRGPLLDDKDLVQRAARAWQQHANILGTGGPEIHLLWAGSRSGRKLVLLGRVEQKSQWLRLAAYVERSAGNGVIERDVRVPRTGHGIMLDDTALLLKGPSADRYRVVADDGGTTTTTRPEIIDGVIEVGRRAMLLPERGHNSVIVVQDGVAGSLGLLDGEREELLAWADQAGDRLLPATLAAFQYGRVGADDAISGGSITPIWRGPLGSTGDVVVVRLRMSGEEWFGLSSSGGTLRFTAPTRLGAVASPGPVACAPTPACQEPKPATLPYLLAGWAQNSKTLVVVGAPAITKVTVRVGTVTRELAGSQFAVSLAGLGLPAVTWSPAVSVVGQTADGTHVPALIGW
jgi:hypothetical protein